MQHRRGKSHASRGNGSGNMASLYNAFGMTSSGGAVANDEEFELFSVSLCKCHSRMACCKVHYSATPGQHPK
jgi:hypothetical protein